MTKDEYSLMLRRLAGHRLARESAPDRLGAALKLRRDLRPLRGGELDRVFHKAVRQVQAHFDPHEVLAEASRRLLAMERQSPGRGESIQQFVDSLPARDRQVLALFKQGKRHVEIAETLGLSVGEVRRSLVGTYSGMRLTIYDAVDQ